MNYAVAKTGVAAASGAAYATLHTGNSRIHIVEFSVFLTTAVTSSIGLIRPSNTPVATTSALGQALGTDTPASLTNIDTAWSTAPTIGSEYLWRVILPAAVSAGAIKTWRPDRPLVLGPNSWLVVWNFGGSTGGAPSIGFEWDEG